MIIEYNASVKTEAGWRSVTIRAEAERISAGMARVTKVILIDAEVPGYGMSRTGARKRISACEIIETEAA